MLWNANIEYLGHVIKDLLCGMKDTKRRTVPSGQDVPLE